ncbi:MAG: hypothetical protein HY980_03095 [Candidatus Magasanikbacteria bacterium]|nr:hypothetical protein [Candidatus Magasanikbacteria bacterium]
MNFAAWESTEGFFGFAPRLKAVQIYLDLLVNGDGERSGLTTAELEFGFRNAFAEAVAFLEQYRKSGDMEMVEKAGDQLCDIVSRDAQPYSLYPHEPIKGKTRLQVKEMLECQDEESP